MHSTIKPKTTTGSLGGGGPPYGSDKNSLQLPTPSSSKRRRNKQHEQASLNRASLQQPISVDDSLISSGMTLSNSAFQDNSFGLYDGDVGTTNSRFSPFQNQELGMLNVKRDYFLRGRDPVDQASEV